MELVGFTGDSFFPCVSVISVAVVGLTWFGSALMFCIALFGVTAGKSVLVNVVSCLTLLLCVALVARCRALVVRKRL